QRASEEVLGGFSLRTEAKIVRHPDRYMDPRGEEMWKTVFAMLDEKDTNGDDRCPQATEGCTGATDVSYILGSRVKSPIVVEKVSSPGVGTSIGQRPSGWLDCPFIKGPLPIPWFARAGRAGGPKVVLIALAIWYRAGLEGRFDGLKLTSKS